MLAPCRASAVSHRDPRRPSGDRRALVAVRAAALPPGTIHYGLTATLVAPGGADGPALLRVGADTVPSDLVVAADGIRSAMRTALYPGHPGLRDCGSASWRTVVP